MDDISPTLRLNAAEKSKIELVDDEKPMSLVLVNRESKLTV